MVSTIIPQPVVVVSQVSPQVPDPHADILAGRKLWRAGEALNACSNHDQRVGWQMEEDKGRSAFYTVMEASGYPVNY